jgi:hypothetical protein
VTDALAIAIERTARPERFAVLQARVIYEAPQLSSVDFDQLPREITSEAPLTTVVLEAREDGTILVGFELFWADAHRGHWVAVARPNEAVTPSTAIHRFAGPSREIIEAVDVDPAMLGRARHLGIAWLAWTLRVARAPTRRDAAAAARPLLGTAVAQLPDVAWVHGQLGATLIWMDQAEDALAALEHARAVGEDFLCERARALIALGRPQDALEALANVTDPRGLLTRGRALRALGRLDEALVDFRDAAAKFRAVCFLDERASVAERLTTLEEDVSDSARLALAETLRELRRFEEAVDAVAALQGEEALLLRGECLAALERWNEALSAYASARDQHGSARARERFLELTAANALRVARPPVRSQTSLDIDATVEHPKFGRGRVVDVEEGNVTFVVVEFERGEQRRLLASLVKLVE